MVPVGYVTGFCRFECFLRYSSTADLHSSRSFSGIKCWFSSDTSKPVFSKAWMKAGSRPVAFLGHGNGLANRSILVLDPIESLPIAAILVLLAAPAWTRGVS